MSLSSLKDEATHTAAERAKHQHVRRVRAGRL
nr:MAG TPA: hypothetical protein [Caudoviricetes sp.]